MKQKSIYFFIIITFLFVSGAQAQSFGKNKVQYRIFEWEYIQTPNFDIYFYEGGKPIAEFTSKIAEDAYTQISRHFNWTLHKRISMILYSSHNDFQQTNIISQYMPEGVGGVTELFKNRIVVPFEGSYEQFRHVIHHELVHGMINDMIYGGSMQSAIANRVQVNIPLWMNEGLAEYLSIEWDTQADMIMRDIAVHNRIPNIRELDYFMAYKGGQSVWKFIAEKYGWEKIGEIIRNIKKSQNVEKGLQRSTGMDFKDLSKQWKKYLKKEYWPDIAGRDELEDFANKITDHDELRNYFNISPAISPDGSKIAILTDRDGYSDIFLISASDGRKIKKVVKGNRSPDFEELKWLQPGISWSPDGKRITFAAKAGKSDALYLLNVKSGKTEKILLDLDGIFSAVWSPEGDRIAFVGNKGKASDIYLYHLKTKVLKNLTKDTFSDFEPSWSSNGDKIAFVSNRGAFDREPDGFTMQNHDFKHTDIYVIDVNSDNIERITATPYDENSPVWSHTTNSIAYTADRNGVWNLYIQDLNDLSEAPKAVSNVLTGIFQLSWSTDDKKLYFSGYSGIGWDIYSIVNPLELEEKEVTKSNFIKNKEVDQGIDALLSSSTGISTIGEQSDWDDASFSKYIFASEYSHYNQQIDSTIVKPETPLTISDFKNADGSYKTHAYKTRFTLDLVNGQASFSNTFGYKGYTLFAFSDILGDHRLFLGSQFEISLENSDYYIAYNYLKRREDYAFALIHTADFFAVNQTDFYRVRHYNLDFAVSRPFNRFQRLEFGLTNHFVNHQLRVLKGFDYVIEQDNTLRLFTYRLNWVFDNSIWGFTAPSDGWRAMLQYNQSVNLYRDKIDFKTIMIDGRRYFKLSRYYDIAFRLMAGYSFGSNPQKFLLGGVENWIFGSGETNGEPDNGRRFNEDELDIFAQDNTDFLQNLYFSIYALPVRGTRFIERVGSKLLLTNFEFRFPFVNYLDMGFPMRIIFSNIRGVAFFDIGAAWDEKFHKTYKKPTTGRREFDDIIAGYGIGIRINFGYFLLRIDTAWDYQMRGSSKPQYYFSLGTDL